MMRWYAGIGSRRTPPEVAERMTRAAMRLEALGFGLRSGAAQGADAAFEAGVSNPLAKQIFLPWRGFNGHETGRCTLSQDAMDMAKRFHPGFEHLSIPAKKLMARNSYQILGPDLSDPVLFVLCWTPDGCESAQERQRGTGGTGQAIAMASACSIPVFNMQRPKALDRLREFLDQQGLLHLLNEPKVERLSVEFAQSK